MSTRTVARRPALFLLALASLGSLAACSNNATDVPGAPSAGQVPDGTVQMKEFQAAFIGSGDGGTGAVTFQGRSYPIKVAGFGIGGIGVSSIEATGDVFGLRDIKRFPGTYGRVRYGFAVGSASAGEMWLQNEAGVVMHLRTKREGLMLSLGGDALVVSMQ